MEGCKGSYGGSKSKMYRNLTTPNPTMPMKTPHEEYIELIEAELEEVVGYAAPRGWKSHRFDKGVELRNKIKDLALQSSKREHETKNALEWFLSWYRTKQAVNTFNECKDSYVIEEFLKSYHKPSGMEDDSFKQETYLKNNPDDRNP
jgi:hypothetical protein